MVTNVTIKFKKGSPLCNNSIVAENKNSKTLSDLKVKGCAQLDKLFNPHLVKRLRKLISVYYAQYQKRYGLSQSTSNVDLLYNLQNKNKEFIGDLKRPPNHWHSAETSKKCHPRSL